MVRVQSCSYDLLTSASHHPYDNNNTCQINTYAAVPYACCHPPQRPTLTCVAVVRPAALEYATMALKSMLQCINSLTRICSKTNAPAAYASSRASSLMFGHDGHVCSCVSQELCNAYNMYTAFVYQVPATLHGHDEAINHSCCVNQIEWPRV